MPITDLSLNRGPVVPALLLVSTLLLPGCAAAPPDAGAPAADKPKAEYDKQTGKLDALVSDRDRDGKPDTWARMDGARLKWIEMDESGDGKPDRWEYYGDPQAPGAQPVIERVEEAPRADGRITRRSFYREGEVQRIEEDTDDDGRVDKWQYFEGGAVTRLEFDTRGTGRADRRLVYRDGVVDHAEADPDGDGSFERVAQESRPR